MVISSYIRLLQFFSALLEGSACFLNFIKRAYITFPLTSHFRAPACRESVVRVVFSDNTKDVLIELLLTNGGKCKIIVTMVVKCKMNCDRFSR